MCPMSYSRISSSLNPSKLMVLRLQEESPPRIGISRRQVRNKQTGRPAQDDTAG